MAVRFKNDTTVILIIAAIGAFALAMAQAGIVFWKLVDMVGGWF